MGTLSPERLIVLSPHLDDAILSVGGSIARFRASGVPVLIATFYTAPPPGFRPSKWEAGFFNYETRKNEDKNACAIVGADYRHFDLVENVLSKKNSFWPVNPFRTPQTASLFTNIQRIAEIIRELTRIIHQ